MKRKPQEFWVLGIVALTISMSVLATLWAQGFFFRHHPESATYQNVTFTDAVLKCESATRTQYNNLLRNLTMDDLSSRLDHEANIYRIFFNAQIVKSSKDSATADFYIHCLINPQSGYMAEYVALEKKESASEALRKNKGGLFGWPLK